MASEIEREEKRERQQSELQRYLCDLNRSRKNENDGEWLCSLSHRFTTQRERTRNGTTTTNKKQFFKGERSTKDTPSKRKGESYSETIKLQTDQTRGRRSRRKGKDTHAQKGRERREEERRKSKKERTAFTVRQKQKDQRKGERGGGETTKKRREQRTEKEREGMRSALLRTRELTKQRRNKREKQKKIVMKMETQRMGKDEKL